MRGFLILFAITIAYVRADVGLGYNYNAGVEGLGVGGVPQAPIVNKHFYVHAAPEPREGEVKRIVIGRPQKNYRIVFIKTPAGAAPRIAAELAPQEEKTAIYVLAQKEHEFNANDVVTPAPVIPSKPEVFFIKYRTQAEAENAQRQIQAQYDLLGGSSQVTDEGTAPVSSVIGSVGSGLGGGLGGGLSGGVSGGLGSASSSQGLLSSGGSGGGSNAYLPPSIFRRRIK